MEKFEIGKTGIMVSKIGLGCIHFGSKLSEEKSFLMMDTYLENGGNFLDTSNNYAFWAEGCDGSESEKVIGNWLEKRKNREKVIIATKLGALPKDLSSKDFSQMQGNSREVILKEVDKSLKRLKTDYIDILYLHIDDRETDLKESLLTLAELKKEGKIRAYGASNFKTWRLHEARKICEMENIDYFSSIQQRFSYLQPASDIELDVQEFVNDELKDYLNYYKDLRLVAYSVMLHGQYEMDEIKKEGYNTEANMQKLESLKDVDNRSTWVLDWVTKQFDGSVALVTTSNVEHLKENMQL